MMRTLAIVAAVVVVAGGFLAYLTMQLQQHGSECDSTLRHCAVAREDVAFLEGDWCLAGDPRRLRESFRFEGDRLLVRREDPQAATPWLEARPFRSMEALIYFEHDAGTGERLTGEIGVAPISETLRQTAIGPRRISWERC